VFPLLLVLAVAIAATPAQAGRLWVHEPDPELIYSGSDGELNDVSIGPAETAQGAGFEIVDSSNRLQISGNYPVPPGCELTSRNSERCVLDAYPGLLVWLGDGADVFESSLVGLPLTVGGEEGDDRLIGGSSAETFFAGDGNDQVSAGAGDDDVSGDSGTDLIEGGDGADRLWGGADADTLRGDAGDDYIDGEDGDDSIVGGDGIDQLDGGVGNDRLSPGAGEDVATGGSGEDFFDTYQGGSDAIYARDGSCDVIRADTSDNVWSLDRCDRSAWSEPGPSASAHVTRAGHGFRLAAGGSSCNGCRIVSFKWKADGKTISSKKRLRYMLPRGKTRIRVRLIVTDDSGRRATDSVLLRRR